MRLPKILVLCMHERRLDVLMKFLHWVSLLDNAKCETVENSFADLDAKLDDFQPHFVIIDWNHYQEKTICIVNQINERRKDIRIWIIATDERSAELADAAGAHAVTIFKDLCLAATEKVMRSFVQKHPGLRYELVGH